MKKVDVRWATLITVVVLLLGWWYWYEYRPTAARKLCASSASEQAQGVFKKKIQTGEFTGGASGDWNLSKEQLLKKYTGYSNYFVRDTIYRQCLEGMGLPIDQNTKS